MTQLKAYHRPQSIEDALQLLGRKHVSTAVLAGGTSLVATLPGEVEEVVDLQAVGLNQVQHTTDQMTIGATVTLQTVVEDPDAPALLRQMAHREGPSTMRRAATMGGAVVGGDAESELLAALLVLQAEVTIQSQTGTGHIALVDFLADSAGSLAGGLITAVSLQKNNNTAHARVARTPQDKPIVAAVAGRDKSGAVHLALCGVANTVVQVDTGAIAALKPPDDFRGSSAYRKQMAGVLSQRVLQELEEKG